MSEQDNERIFFVYDKSKGVRTYIKEGKGAISVTISDNEKDPISLLVNRFKEVTGIDLANFPNMIFRDLRNRIKKFSQLGAHEQNLFREKLRKFPVIGPIAKSNFFILELDADEYQKVSDSIKKLNKTNVFYLKYLKYKEKYLQLKSRLTN
jgi:hypothetical protein